MISRLLRPLRIIDGTPGADSLVGGSAGDELFGYAGNDTLLGNGGDDWLQPGSGRDTVNGGTGRDFLSYEDDDSDAPAVRGVDVDLAAGTAIDSWNSTDTLIGIEWVFGSSRGDRLAGNSQGNDLNGRGGNDTLAGGAGGDWLQPGPGDDTVDGGSGFDFVSYQNDASVAAPTRGVVVDLARGTATDSWNATDTLIGIEWAFGSSLGDRLTGNGLENVFYGGGGNDTLAGGGGEDWLDPGRGNDAVNGGAGADVVSYEDAGGDIAAANGVNANLRAGTARDPWGGSDVLTGIENAVGSWLDDTLTGAGENSLLDGRAGDDRLIAGSLVYEADPAGVFVNLSSTARTRDGITVAARTAADGFGGTDVLGSGVISGYGSPFDDTWFGGSQNAFAILRGGDDYLRLGAGDDWLQGGSGNDTLDAGGGYDGVSYEDDGFDSAGPAFQGVRVNLATGSAIDGWNGSDVLIGIEDVYGSDRDDALSGNADWNYLDGGAGDDTLAGLGGDDYILGGTGNDRVDGGPGQDFFAVGGASLDDYRVVRNTDGSITVTDLELADGDDGTDTLLGIEQLGLAVLGTAAADIIASDGADPILAIGKSGDDRYVLRFDQDQVVERPGQGTDTVEAGIDRVLEPNVENLLLTGSADLAGTGNSAANRLTGNSGANVLDGGAGADTLAGGAGDDTYHVDSASDRVTEEAGAAATADPDPLATGGGIDTVIAQVSYTLRANVENLKLAGSTALSGTGNELDNVLTGNGAANRLGGLAGADILDGAGGNDTLAGGAGNDTLGGGAGADHFLFDTPPAAGNVDTLVDFTPGSERIRLDDDAFSAFDAALASTLGSTQFHAAAGAGAAQDGDDRIVYDTLSGALYYDADGSGGAAAIRFAVLAGHPALSAGDFLIAG